MKSKERKAQQIEVISSGLANESMGYIKSQNTILYSQKEWDFFYSRKCMFRQLLLKGRSVSYLKQAIIDMDMIQVYHDTFRG